MTAAAAELSRSFETWRMHLFTLVSGYKAWKGAELGLDPATGKVKPMGTDDDLIYIGSAVKTVDAAGADAQVNVDLGREIRIKWWANDSVSPITVIGGMAYALDDTTATKDASNAPIGRAWAISSVDGVAIEKLESLGLGGAGGGGGAPAVALPDYASNVAAPTDIVNGATYDIKATAAASVVVLPAAAEDGTRATFSADGVKNGHTVQYRDETGAVNLTTALTALKRHLVYAEKVDGSWRANAYVSP